MTKLLGLAPLVASALFRAFASPAAIDSEIDLVSSDPQIAAAFRWAKKQALEYVFDGDPVGPYYEAALPGRRAFCMRDTAHQADGAQVLGLARWNHNMLRRFAVNIAESRDWCSFWEIDSQNRPAPVDYKNDKQFWYNLPANYDVLDACYRMFLWTGDRSYLDDPVFLNFYERTIVDYTARWSLAPDRIMQRTSDIDGPPYFRGDPTYEESSLDNVIGIDLLATQYAAFRAYAAIQTIRGEVDKAQTALHTAAQIRKLINTKWWNAKDGYYYAFYTKQHRLTGRAGADVLYRDAAESATQKESAITTLLATMRSESVEAVEAKSHYAEILYRYGRSHEAYDQIIDLSKPGRIRQEYPEVSYSVVGALVTGMMGIGVEPSSAATSVVVTQPSLTASTEWAELRNLPVLGSTITVRHQQSGTTFFTNHGPVPLRWKPVFTGSSVHLQIDGRTASSSRVSGLAGQQLVGVPVMVTPGQTLKATVR